MKKWQCTVCKYIHAGEKPPEKCPVCGVSQTKFVLQENKPQKDGSAKNSKISETVYERITGLMVKHHAHPVSVHMPNGLIPVIAVMFVLSFIFNSSLFGKVGFINLIFVVLSLPLVLYSGFLEWKKKYRQARTRVFKKKILAASITTASCIISVCWYIADPLVLSSSLAWLFIILNFVMLTCAGVAGHIGGKLVFKK
jgi:uncharacterized membrane protein